MSQPKIPKRAVKNTCRKCNRIVHVQVVAGDPVELDPELIQVVPMDGKLGIFYARRIHGERCDHYREEARRARITEERKAFEADPANRVADADRPGRP